MNRVPSELGVRLQPGSEPIAGEVRLPDGSTRTFQGYVQLIAAVERAHHGAADAGPEPDRGEERHVG